HVAVEAEAESCAVALEQADGVGPVDFDVLADRFESVCFEPIENKFRDRLFLSRGAGEIDEIAAEPRQFVAVDLREHFLRQFLVEGHGDCSSLAQTYFPPGGESTGEGGQRGGARIDIRRAEKLFGEDAGPDSKPTAEKTSWTKSRWRSTATIKETPTSAIARRC